jgi:hypothetical protein
MPYTSTRTLKPRFMPKLSTKSQLAGLAGGPGILIVQLEARLMQAHAELEARPNVSADDFNAIVTNLNRVRDELLAVTGAQAPARLEREAAETIAAFDHLMSTGSLPDGYSTGESKTPWLLIGLGIAAVAGVWMWSRNQQLDALEGDCGCDG